MNAAVSEPLQGAPASEQAATSNFYYSFLFLPSEQRDAILDVYAFCHEVDDLVDHPAPGTDPRGELDRWRRDIDALYDGGSPSARAARLAPHLARFPLPRQAFLDILDGVAMDLEHDRYRTWEELRLYCRRVASAVGLLCIEIFGHRNPRSRDYAVELGLALQLTNILRDVEADARRGRIYLPGEDLENFGVTEEDVLQGRLSDSMRELLAFECQRARNHFFRAQNVLPPEDRMPLYAAEIMSRIYLLILERIEQRRFDVWGKRISVSGSRKALIAFSVWFKYKLMGGAG
jgi:phytoene synthase